MPDWNTDKSLITYNVPGWGAGYFDISRSGNLVVNMGDSAAPIDLLEVVQLAQQQGLALPLLARFPHILHKRVDDLCQAFDSALANAALTSHYTPVYPIKVNQNRNVVEELLNTQSGRLGLEAGSKPELLTVLALSRDNGTIICNGYKDREYIRLALAGSHMGLNVYIVIEKLSELDTLISECRRNGIRPQIGIRLKLASIASGKWQSSGGERSKFGLTSSQVLTAIETLSAAGLLDCLKLLHVHLGSQISSIRDIQNGLGETAQFFVQLAAQGIAIKVIDIGGGLAVDYEGSGTRSECSMNYQLDEYAEKVVHAFSTVCVQHGLQMPDIFSESGRALTAHHAVLITDVTEVEQNNPDPSVADEYSELALLIELQDQLTRLQQGGSVLEVYHNVSFVMQEIQQQFNLGMLDLKARAAGERLYYTICHRLLSAINPANRAHQPVLDELNEILADKVFCNFSIFQSIPDVWAIDQIFPVMPLQRLDEQPLRRAILHDLTCDSDGRIDLYTEQQGIENTLPLHDIKPAERYLLGFFLVGAYQETLGDIHNLFGDTATVNVSRDEQGNVQLDNIFNGENVSHLLRKVEYDPEQIRQRIIDRASSARLPDEERKVLLEDIQSSLQSTSYLVKEDYLQSS